MNATSNDKANLDRAAELSGEVRAGTASGDLIADYNRLRPLTKAIYGGTADAYLIAQRNTAKTLIAQLRAGTAPAELLAEYSLFKDRARSLSSYEYDFSIRASRTGTLENPLVSPAAVSFAAFGANDVFPRDEGFYWDADDPASGDWGMSQWTSIFGADEPKNNHVGSPLWSHTFERENGTGQGVYRVLCRSKDQEGNESLGYVDIHVAAQDSVYSGSETIAISNTLTVEDDWSLNSYDDVSVPSGAEQYESIAAMLTTRDDDLSGCRVLLKAGDDFSSEGNFSILTGNHDFVIDRFGDIADDNPIIGNMLCGVKSSGSQFFDISSAQLSSASTKFGNDGWVENAVIANIRSPLLSIPMSCRFITYHKIDADFENDSSGGGAKFYNGDTSWRSGTDDLEPAEVGFPVGCTFSECTIYSSTVSPAHITIEGTNNPCPVWLSIIGCSFRYAVEHNIRVHGTQLGFVGYNELFEPGDANGPKHNITMRGVGYNQTGYRGDLTRASNGMGDASDRFDYKFLPVTEQIVVTHNYCSPGQSSTSALITVSPTNDSSEMLCQDFIIRKNHIVDGPQFSAYPISFSGRRGLITENTKDAEVTETRVNDRGSDAAIDDLSNNNVFNGVVDPDTPTILNMLSSNGDNLNDWIGEADHVLPVPSPPR